MVGCLLVVKPDNPELVCGLAYVVFGAFGAALARSWQLLQPERTNAPGALPASPERAGLGLNLARGLLAAGRALPWALGRWRRGTPGPPG